MTPSREHSGTLRSRAGRINRTDEFRSSDFPCRARSSRVHVAGSLYIRGVIRVLSRSGVDAILVKLCEQGSEYRSTQDNGGVPKDG